jgi:hypothetical protein
LLAPAHPRIVILNFADNGAADFSREVVFIVTAITRSPRKQVPYFTLSKILNFGFQFLFLFPLALWLLVCIVIFWDWLKYASWTWKCSFSAAKEIFFKIWLLELMQKTLFSLLLMPRQNELKHLLLINLFRPAKYLWVGLHITYPWSAAHYSQCLYSLTKNCHSSLFCLSITEEEKS